MKILKVPYAEKDQAKALGARWNAERKAWYVPDGTETAPFERWLAKDEGANEAVKAGSKESKDKVDSYVGRPTVGVHYIELKHDCNPFTECVQCRPALVASGWVAAHDAVKLVIAAL
ncbi:DUF5710 domain-containing protein [Massilia psychrophila]|uniref:DUF5710 domain-containing protein n=1 Tax=Massilia psychrophila TaxID=1603353 RepID=A0A2G8SWJ4_9BURK|nr:DUF5710 domain-containing protein [Massilia psychrophila]PIL38157.1 hypothetical protein CR103_19420 [Massilia psychrophila]GGE91064.1 hypothetical protein GCM10008020_40060 [Massilia psychrophila]